MSDLDLSSYFKRIGHREEIEVSEKTLRSLHCHHSETIPFENLDAVSGMIPSWDIKNIFQKLVVKKRGGWCFEQNELFLQVLKKIGFDCRPIMARVLARGNELGIRTHYLGYVLLNGQEYLVDVGFGHLTPRYPLLINSTKVEQQSGVDYQIIVNKEFGKVLRARSNQDWAELYTIELEKIYPCDVAVANYWASKSKDCLFSSIPIVELKREGREVKIIGKKLIIQSKKFFIKGSLEFRQSLSKYFDISLDENFAAKTFDQSQDNFIVPQRYWRWS